MSVVKEILVTFLPPKRKQTPSGWLSFNAPCCHHNGTSADTRGRGGLISNGDGGLSYHCFNCGYKASWQPGRNLSHKLKKLLQWLGAPDDTISKLALDIIRLNEDVVNYKPMLELPTFNTVALPPSAKRIQDWGQDQNLDKVIEYMRSRNFQLDDTDFYWSPELGYRDRLIVPFFYNNNVVGWTARTILDTKKPKYLSEQQPGFVYNLDEQSHNKSFVIVCEGPLDAIHIDGVALLGSEIKDQQALLINSLNKQVILIPDRDLAGSKLIEQAIELGWSVSLPDWPQGISDIGDCVRQNGRLYTLYSIVSEAETNKLKIQLKQKRWNKYEYNSSK